MRLTSLRANSTLAHILVLLLFRMCLVSCKYTSNTYCITIILNEYLF